MKSASALVPVAPRSQWSKSLYEVSKTGLTEPLAGLRERLRNKADELRLDYRSRIGRLWAAQFLDEHLGDMLREELESEPAPAVAFEAIEATKARGLLDAMCVEFRELEDDAAAREAESLRQRLLRYETSGEIDLELSEALLGSRLPIISQRDPQGRLRILDELRELYRDHGAGFDRVAPASSLSEIQAALGAGEAFIAYAVPYHWSHPAIGVWMLAVTRDRAALVRAPIEILPGTGMIGTIETDATQPIDESPLGVAIWGLRRAIRQGREIEAQRGLEEMHSLLIAPLVAEGFDPEGHERWIVSPQGMLHHVPWAALSDADGRRLIESTALTFVPSASVWHRLVATARPTPTSFLGLANPELEEGLPPLKASEKELQRISVAMAGLTSLRLQGPEATESALRANVAGKSIVHLASHGDFPEQNPLDLHRLLLAADRNHDGHVHAEELRGMDFRSAWLVVLSICDGALYRLGPGDEPYGIIPALLGAGATNVVGTLWPLDDQRGRELMTDFYDGLLDSGPAEALRQAVLLRAGRQPVELWAPFMVVGPGRPPAAA